MALRFLYMCSYGTDLGYALSSFPVFPAGSQIRGVIMETTVILTKMGGLVRRMPKLSDVGGGVVSLSTNELRFEFQLAML
jgi:hypothetical protein